jgi:hypothetical protein
MSRLWVKSLGLAGVVGLIMAGTAQARTVDLVDNAGVSSGWSATIPDTSDGGSVSLSFVRSADGVFYFDKTATLTTNDAALVIEFNRTSANASTLAIGTESITNSTGTDWTGFRTFVSTATAAGSSGVGFQLSLASGGFNIDPFTIINFTNNNTEMDVTGGTVANGTAWTPGTSTDGGVAIISGNSADDRFLLKEIALTGGSSGGGPTPIPLPAAAWTGMSTLLGLALLGAAKRVRHA